MKKLETERDYFYRKQLKEEFKTKEELIEYNVENYKRRRKSFTKTFFVVMVLLVAFLYGGVFAGGYMHSKGTMPIFDHYTDYYKDYAILLGREYCEPYGGFIQIAEDNDGVKTIQCTDLQVKFHE